MNIEEAYEVKRIHKHQKMSKLNTATRMINTLNLSGEKLEQTIRVKLTTHNKEDIVLATIERLAIYKPCLVDMAITRNQFDELAKGIVEALK